MTGIGLFLFWIIPKNVCNKNHKATFAELLKIILLLSTVYKLLKKNFLLMVFDGLTQTVRFFGKLEDADSLLVSFLLTSVRIITKDIKNYFLFCSFVIGFLSSSNALSNTKYTIEWPAQCAQFLGF